MSSISAAMRGKIWKENLDWDGGYSVLSNRMGQSKEQNKLN